jgi:hypothetical protein
VNLDDAPQFLSTEQLHTALAELVYRPGWELSIYRHPWEGTVFRVVADVTNSYRPDETVRLQINSPVPPMTSVEQFHHWLVWRLTRIESHETREWLRKGDRPLFDPHDVIEPTRR